MKKKSKTKKYAAPMTLGQARSVATCGPLAGTKLAQAALLLWPCEKELDQAETGLAETLHSFDDLVEMEYSAIKRLWKFNAGMSPDFLRRRSKLINEINKLRAKYIVLIDRAEQRRALALELRDKAKVGYDREYNDADRKTRHGLKELRTRYNNNAEVADPVGLKLLDVIKKVVLAEKLHPKPEDHHGVYDIVLTPQAGLRYRMPWLVDMMPLSSPELQEKLTVKQIMLQTGETGKALADTYRRKAKALGIQLAHKPAKEPELGRFCGCGEPLEKYQRRCVECAFHYRPSYPAHTLETIGRKTEASWQREDRRLEEWGRDKRRISFEEYLDEELVIDESGEHKAALIGIQDQTTRDVEDIIAAHEAGSEGWGGNNWKQIKFTLDHKLPYHQDLGDVGKGFDADENDY
jgi:hypothetical protein